MSQTHETKPFEWPMLIPDLGYGAALDTGRQALDRWTHGVFECGAELSAFAMARWQEDLESWKALANCRSMDELLQCQCGIVQKAASDYMAEAGKLAQVMMGAANAMLRDTPSQAAAQQPWDVARSEASPPPRRQAASRARPAAAPAPSSGER